MSKLIKPPARLFVALSGDKKRNLIIRRGPTRQVATFLWDRTKNTFTLGQWLKGRIYEHRLDISPDGRHMIYFATKPTSPKTWTTVSKTPWLKALDFHSWIGTWGGGGLFAGNDAYILNGNGDSSEVRLLSGLSIVAMSKKYDALSKTINHSSVDSSLFHNTYGLRLLRDGWSFVSGAKETGDHITRFSKTLKSGWYLYKCIRGGQRENRSAEHETHTLINPDKGISIDMPNWEWAEFRDSKVFWAEAGSLYEARPEKEGGVGKPKLLHDFNEYVFQERLAPY